MLHPSCIELSKPAFQKNLEFLQDYIGKDVRISAVIKGNAYGHGIDKYMPMAEECGIRHFSVFSADEAQKALRARTADSDIMIMGMIENEELGWAIEMEISFHVFEMDRLKAALETARRLRKPARIHLQVETGMNRLGFSREGLEKAVRLILEHPDDFVVEGLCTHYAGAESISNYVRIKKQIQNFQDIDQWVKARGIEPKMRHTACSAAALTYPETVMDMVRIGIALYGFWPSRETYMHVMKNGELRFRKHDPLERVISWKSSVMSIKDVDRGEFVGYGNVYLTSKPSRIATVPIGYAHGFGRNLTNMGRVLINGVRAPVAGLVNMNMLTVDVSDVPGVRKGDPVVIIGVQNGQEITVASFSEMSNNLNYEVLTRLPSDLPRVVTEKLPSKPEHTEAGPQ